MHTRHILLLTASISLLQGVFTAPTAGKAQKRSPGDKDEPIDWWDDCADQEHICDANCMDILCFGADRVLQRDNTDRSGKNTKSGAGVQPFRGDEASLKKRGVPNVPPAGFVSPEENTYEGTAQGGANTHLSPVPNAEQEVQKNALQNAYRQADPPIQQKMWFKRNFKNFGDKAPHCKALMQDPPDTLICDKDMEKEGQDYDPKKYTIELDDPFKVGYKHFHGLWGGPKKRSIATEDSDHKEQYRNVAS